MREDGVPEVDNLPVPVDEESRTYQAHDLRCQGLPWEEVAIRTGYASAAAANVAVRIYLQRAAMELSQERKQESLAMEIARLDALQNALWRDAMDGDAKAVDSVLRVINTRAKLLGLDTTTEVKTSQTTIVVARGDTESYTQALRLVTGELEQ